MGFLKLPVVAFLCAVGAVAAPSRLDYAVKERHSIPPSWRVVGDAPRDHILHLQIGLKQSNEDVLESHLLEISDPKHHRYKQYLSLDEITRLTQPSKETQERVEAWLDDHDVREYIWNEPSRDWISVNITIEKAGALLQTKYSTYLHLDSSASVYRTKQWSLPKHLHEHIDVIQPTTSFFRAAPRLPRENIADIDARSVLIRGRDSADSLSKVCKESTTTPECVRTLYGTINYTPQVPGKNKIAITNYLNQSSHRGDVAKFLRKYRPDAVSAAEQFEIVIIAGAGNQQGPYNTSDPDYMNINIEGDLDAEVALSVSWPTPLTVYNTGGFAPDEENEPFVISTSYGDDEPTLPKSYARRVCQGFAQLGVRGVSVLFSAGDHGVAGRNGTCPGGKFVPHFPASCPWVTAVGGTREFQPETALDYGGGGFSNYFERPAYQQHGVVDAYIRSLDGKYDGRYNKLGRGYPDVAAHGDRMVEVQAGEVTSVSGTSASTPIFAGVISLVNDALLAKGEPPLGFLNPWIYNCGYQALTDIIDKTTYGGCHTGSGFTVQKGWDAVTGFGTPNFEKLVKAAFAK